MGQDVQTTPTGGILADCCRSSARLFCWLNLVIMLGIRVALLLFLSASVVTDQNVLEGHNRDVYMRELLKRLLDLESRNTERLSSSDSLAARSPLTGISADKEVKAAYEAKKSQYAYVWIICKVNDDKTRVVVESKATTGTFDDFANALRKLNSPRFVIYDSPPEWQLGQKPIFFTWIPEGSDAKTKMVYASTREHMKSQINNEVNAGEITSENSNDELQNTLQTALAKSMK